MGYSSAGLGRALLAVVALSAALLLALPALGPAAKPHNKPGKPQGDKPVTAEPDRYSLAGGCWGLRSNSTGAFVTKGGGSYAASAGDVSAAEPFFMQATTLGRYLFYGPARDFMAAAGDATEAAGEPSDASDWTVEGANGDFTVVNRFDGRQLAVGAGGALVTVPAGSAGDAGSFDFRPASGCSAYPEVEVNATGAPSTGSPTYGEVSGLLEGHMHGMAYEFLGGRAHCGKPWHRFGAPFALTDCPDHVASEGCGAVLENVLYGNPARCHDPVGWPTFRDWPNPKSLTHEQSYYKWIERAWRGGLRVYVNLLVENRVLCEVYPLKQNNCDEMASVELQAQRLYEMQDYIDAQNGGPGKGWFRIVTNPFEAREVANEGKLAVIMGMEVSEPFGCRLVNRMPTCDEAQIDGWLDRLHEIGVRQLEIVNKFDNALTGVAGDSGSTGAAVNTANFLSTGSFWDLETCQDPENHDNSPSGPEVHNDDLILGNGLNALIPGGLAPVYPEGPHCNRRGLSALGEHAVRGIMDREMIFDPDHMSVYARNQALDLVESVGYSGIVSSHSWSDPKTLPRIYGLGGVITPYAGSSEEFVEQWQQLRGDFNGRQYFGVGYGADMNGFGSQGLPRGADVPNPVTYPFTSFDGQVTLDRQISGERVFDINTDGVAHYGLYPDWVEDLRMIAGDQITSDLGRGAEAYLQMWERAEGIGPVSCDGWQAKRFSKRGLTGRLLLSAKPRQVLESAGQPVRRKRAWRWCTSSAGGADRHEVAAVFTRRARVGLIFSTIRKQKAGGVAVGARAGKLDRHAKRLSSRLWVQDAGRRGRQFVYTVRAGRVQAVGLASRAVASRPKILRKYLKLAKRG